MATEDRRTRPPRSGSTGHRVDCGQIRELLFAYMTHELPDAQALLVREHLRHCAGCSAEAAEIQRTLEFMKRHDPGAAAPSRFSAKRRRRLLWLMEHPFVALCLKYHKVTAAVVAVVVVALVLAGALTFRRYKEAAVALPPVNVLPNEPETIRAPLEPPQPLPGGGQAGIPGLEPFDPVVDEPEAPPPPPEPGDAR